MMADPVVMPARRRRRAVAAVLGALVGAGLLYVVVRPSATRSPAAGPLDARPPVANEGRTPNGRPAPPAALPGSEDPVAAGAEAGAGFDCGRPQGAAVRIDELELSIARVCARMRIIGGVRPSGAIDHAQARLVIEQLIDGALVARALGATGGSVSDDDVETAMAAFDPGATAGGLTLLREQVRERLEVETLLAARGRAEITEREVDDELARGAPGIDRGGGLRLDGWIARVAPGAVAAADDAARKLAEAFAASPGTSTTDRPAGLTPVPAFVLGASGVEPELEQAAQSLDRGQWSPAIRTRVGWVVIRVLDRVEARPVDPVTLRALVRQALTRRRDDRARQALMAELRSAARIEWLVEL